MPSCLVQRTCEDARRTLRPKQRQQTASHRRVRCVRDTSVSRRRCNAIFQNPAGMSVGDSCRGWLPTRQAADGADQRQIGPRGAPARGGRANDGAAGVRAFSASSRGASGMGGRPLGAPGAAAVAAAPVPGTGDGRGRSKQPRCRMTRGSHGSAIFSGATGIVAGGAFAVPSRSDGNRVVWRDRPCQ